MKWFYSKPKLLIGRPCNATTFTDETLNVRHKLDQATGQVYTETKFAIPTAEERDWTRQTRVVVGPDYRDSEDFVGFLNAFDPENTEASLAAYHDYVDGLKNTRVRGFIGARSLQDSAVECILNNISDVTYDGIVCLPIALVRRIWHAINKRCLLSFNTWMIFSKILYDGGDGSTLNLLRYRQAISKPVSPLHLYTQPITSSSFEFITSLSITFNFPLPDLVKISKIKNLGVLEIINIVGMRSRRDYYNTTPIAVSDRLMRAWHSATLNDGCFRVLRVLKLWNHQALSSKSLVYLNDFPALAVYDVQGCAFDIKAKTEAKRLGWKALFETNVLGLLEAACVERAMNMQESLGIQSRPIRRASARQLWDGSETRTMPRSEIPSFLNRPEAFISGEPLVGSECYQLMQQSLDELECKNIKDLRWDIMDRHLFSKTRALETWEFNTYTSFTKIGELRNDADFSRSGIDVGDHVVLVGNEFVSSIPIVSIRLGETPTSLQASSFQCTHKPFYSSIHSVHDVPSLDERNKRAPSAKTMSFVRIKVPPTQQPAESLTKKFTNNLNPQSYNSSQASSSRAPSFKAPATKASSTKVPSSQAGPTKRRAGEILKNKKRKIGEMLNSFL